MIENPKYSRETVTGKRVTVFNSAGESVFEGVIMTTSGQSERTFHCSLIPHRETEFIRRHGLRVVGIDERLFNQLEYLDSRNSFQLKLRDSVDAMEFLRTR